MGRHSIHLKIIEEMIANFMIEDPELSYEEAIELATTVKNERHIERGYIPQQWFLGEQSNPVDSMLNGDVGPIS